MNSSKIREKFLKYFEENNHKRLNSASLIPIDETLLFTAAGMVPLKDYFLGNKKADNPNMVSSQKCVRTVDIDIIGDTDRHLSFFEMLGNFSIGSYFKKEAIKYSYEFITKELGVDKDKLWFTVYKDDQEALDIWINDIGVPEERIQKGNEDNFWHMNIPGPCGPCSEIFIDRGEKYGEDGGPIGGGEDRFIEIWNLVFMESIQDQPFQVIDELPNKNIDTGMGLERIAMILQEKETLFDTDLFSPLSNELKTKIDKSNSKFEKVIIDHIKTTTFMLADGVVPTNEGRGYILRRLIRRAVRANNQLCDEYVSLSYLIDVVVDMYKQEYPELLDQKNKIHKLFSTEEDLFNSTIKKGLNEINDLISKNKLTEKEAFYLFETFGFPYELTKEICQENNINLDDSMFKNYFDEHKEKSKKINSTNGSIEDFEVDENIFKGYDTLETESELYHIEQYDDKTILFGKEHPFYYEAGGQISDKGTVIIENQTIEVNNVFQSSNGAVGVVVNKINLDEGQKVKFLVDSAFRNAVSKSHSAAHIVHASLRNVLGDHVAQAGSNVAPGKFRFDFSHTEKVRDEELNHIFEESNKVIFNDFDISTKIMNIDDAKKEGALAFFGDKYDDDVRVVSIGSYSKELCGGTHVSNSHDVGLIVLMNESSIGSNLRRVEMLSGFEAYEFLSNAYKSYKSVSNILKVSEDQVSEKLNSQLELLEEYKLKLDGYKKLELNNIVSSAASNTKDVAGFKTYLNKLDVESPNELRTVAINLIKETDIDVVLLISDLGQKTSIVGSTKENVSLNISTVVTELSKLFGGGASKDENLSIGGGPQKYSIDDALVTSLSLLQEKL
jgi:alanyl-tRNA synthetase